MRKITKLMLTLVLLAAGVVGVNADNATLDQLTAANGTGLSNIPASYPVSVTDAVIFGSDASSQVGNANVNNYDYLYVTVTDFVSAVGVRIFFWDPNQNKRLDYYLKPVADKETANFEAQSSITGNGTYCVKIPDGARLQGAKAPWGTSSDVHFKISEIYLTERAVPYVELVPYTLEWTPNGSTYRATIPISESHIRTTGGVSIDYSTGVVTSTGTGTLVIYLNKEDLVGATGYNLVTSDNDLLGDNLDITDAVNGEVGGIYGSRNSWWIANDSQRKDKIGAITALKYNFSAAKSWTITNIYFDADQLIAQTTNKDLTTMPYGKWQATANVVSQYVEADNYKTNNIDGNAHNDVLFGRQNNSDANYYVDLTNCSKIIFTGFSSNAQIRLFYNWDGTDANKPIETISDFPTTAGTYVFDIDAFKKAKGITFFHLIGIKSAWADVTLSSVTVDEYTNKIVGSGINRVKNYLTNPYLTSIDATGVTAAVELPTANPNCLITATADKVTNAQNVIVDGTCANLVLTDGYDFKAPANFTASAASYTTTINTTAQAGTLCLPFAATLPSDVEAYTLTYSSGNAATATEVEGTIPANTPVLLNGSGEVTFTGSGAVAANAENKSGAMTGVFTQGFVPSNSYVLQLLNNELGFRKVADDGSVSINPFRAYLTAQGAGSRLSINFGDVTGIETVATAEKNEGKAYDLQGRRVAQPTKGLYIVNGKKYFVQ